MNNHQYNLPVKKKNVFTILAAMVNVISLKCVQQITKPKNVTAWKTKNEKTPVFHAVSCSYSYA